MPKKKPLPPTTIAPSGTRPPSPRPGEIFTILEEGEAPLRKKSPGTSQEDQGKHAA